MRSYVVAGVVVVIAQLALIVGLLVQRARCRRAELALREVEKRSSAVLRAIPDLMFVLRRDGTYLDYHVRDPALLFVPPEHFLGKRVVDIMPQPTAQMMMDALERACVTDEPVIVEYVLPMGEPHHYEARLVHAGDDRVLSIVREVTETKRAAQLNRELVGRLISVQEAERTWIARELHDGVLQDLAAVNLEFSHLRQKGADLSTREAHDSLIALHHRMSSIATSLRLLSHGLHPTVLQHIGLVAALEAHCAEFERQQEVKVRFFTDHEDQPVSRPVSLSLFRIAQEALRNTARHGGAAEATVSLIREDGYLRLAITDDGRGFDLEAARRNGGLGLVSIEERARLVQGRVTIDAKPGRGTRIDVRVPVDLVDRR